jgi:hypothetical protein
VRPSRFLGTEVYPWDLHSTFLTEYELAMGIHWLARRGLQISINYIEDSGPLPSRAEKRGRSSVTTRMLAGRDAQIDAEQISGYPPVWCDV